MRCLCTLILISVLIVLHSPPVSGQTEVPTGVLGDVNEDGIANFLDICLFVELLSEGGFHPDGDVNKDGVINLLDVDPFVVTLLCSSGDLSSAAESVPGDFFWSLEGLNSGAVNQGVEVELNVGESVTLYLYFTTDGPTDTEIDAGVQMDITTSTPGIIKFLTAETYNYDVVFTAQPEFVAAQRWADDSTLAGGFFGPAFDVADELIECLTALTILGTGMVEDNSGNSSFLDEGFDSDANAFLFGAVEFCAVSPGKCSLVVDNVGIANDCTTVNEIKFAPASITVASEVLLGDVNLDGEVNLLDIDFFIALVASNTYQAEADCNMDGEVNLLDIDFFIAILGGP